MSSAVPRPARALAVVLTAGTLASLASAQGSWSPVYDWSTQLGEAPPQCSQYDELSHAALIPKGTWRGKVLLWHFGIESNCSTGGTTELWVFDPAHPNKLLKVSQTLASNIFCSGASWDRQGRLLVAGGIPAGSTTYEHCYRFDPAVLGLAIYPFPSGNPIITTSGPAWTQLEDMSLERYYPTLMPLNRRSVTACGTSLAGEHVVAGGPPTVTNEGNEIWEVIPQPTATPCALVPAAGQVHTPSGTSETYALTGAPEVLLDSYPRMFQLTNDEIFVAGDVDTGRTGPSTPGQSWVMRAPYGGGSGWELVDGPDAGPAPGMDPTNDRHYGTAILLHQLGPGGRDRIFAFGGSQDLNFWSGGTPDDQTNTTLQEFVPGPGSAANGTWLTHVSAGPNPSGRIFANAVTLPTGDVLIEGGSSTARPLTPVHDPVLYTPGAPGQPGTSQLIAGPPPPQTARLYHHLSVLLPDGRVFIAGGEQYSTMLPPSSYTGQIYSPAYPSYRPTIDSVSATAFYEPGVFTRFTVEATTVQGPIARVVLLRPAAITHHFDNDQRYVELPFAASTSAPGPVTLTVAAPTDDLGPPGWYMLFVLESGPNGLAPSTKATFVDLQ